jgi:hypothetical protein
MKGFRFASLGAAVALVACASGGSSPAPSGPVPPAATSTNPAAVWPIRTAEYVDVWLHSYAMLTTDTIKVPLFARNYRSMMTKVRSDRNVTTALDANRATLEQGLATNGDLVAGQFVVFNFASLDELLRTATDFIKNDGSPTGVTDPTQQQLFVVLRSAFRTVKEREWLRLFVQAVQDEDARFYKSYWTAQQTDRAAAFAATQSAWNNTYRAKFLRYLRNERLGDGTMVLSLPLGGEGRSIIDPRAGNAVGVNYPATADSALNPLYTFAHEVVGNAAGRALEDNLTPAERREGADARYTPIAAVRGGAILLSKIAPELLAGYERYYLGVTGAAIPSGDPAAAFAAAYALPDPLVKGIERQIDLVLAGI